jgi:hypothetical protein
MSEGKEEEVQEEDSGMRRETAGSIPDSIKGDPRNSYRAPDGEQAVRSLTPATRLRHPPMIRKASSTQQGNIIGRKSA